MINNSKVKNSSPSSVPDNNIKFKGRIKSNNLKWWQWILMYPTLLVAIIGAIPKYSDWIRAFVWQIPTGTVELAKEQLRLWNDNFECSKEKDVECIETPANYKIGAIVCPTGDVLVKVDSPEEKNPFYRWIGMDTFLEAKSIFSPKEAEGQIISFNQPIILAKSEVVLCQKRDKNDYIIRIAKDSRGKCWKEKINPRTGKVIIRRSVSCDSSCD